MILILCVLNLLACDGPTAPDPEPSPQGMNGPSQSYSSSNIWMQEECLKEAQRFYEYLLERGNPYGAEQFLKEYYPELAEQFIELCIR